MRLPPDQHATGCSNVQTDAAIACRAGFGHLLETVTPLDAPDHLAAGSWINLHGEPVIEVVPREPGAPMWA